MSSPKPPAPRAVLTSLINALTTAPREAGATASGNALKSLPQSQRPLLITLHVLFPSFVLPALDLLDRDLVARVVRDDTNAGDVDLDLNEDPADDDQLEPQQPPSSKDAEDQGAQRDTAGPSRREPAAFYVVRSVASTMSRRKKADADSATSSSTTKYLVHLDAWNCTCANFAFEAFPPGGENEVEIQSTDAEVVDEASLPEWQFGGLSMDGTGRGDVPCCKHLLACLVAERWGTLFFCYITESRVSRAAIAGMVGDM